MTEIATYLGPKGYSIKKEYLDIQEQHRIRKELTVLPFVPKSSLSKPNPFPIYRESKKKLYVPKYYGFETYGIPDDNTVIPGDSIDLKFKGQLRDFQKPIVNKFVKHVGSSGGGLLEVPCGRGKTVMGLNIIAQLKTKTLIIVHKEFLLRQWMERIQEFLPTARIGRIQGEILDIDDKDIVMGMLQSLSMKEYPNSVFDSFGLTIIDEVHHIGAEVFSRALFKIVTPYMLGLSATMDRKDNLSNVFKLFIGPVVHSEQRKGGDNVLVRSINYYHDDEEFATQVLNYKGQVHYSVMIKKLCEFNFRSEFILRVLKDLFEENPNQQIIVLGHNKSLLAYLHDAIQHRNIESVGYYVGGMKEKDLKITETKKIIIATYAMAEEGLDIKTLTTLLMATPKTDVRQAVGRILRQKHGTPLIIDIVDQHELFKRQWLKRKRYYKKQKYKIVSTDMDSYNKKEWTTLFENGKIKKSKKKDAGIPQDKFLQGVCMIGDD
jgi:superfamily II DNA or RNA helicase